MTNRHTLDFLAEAGLLKRVKRSGWWMLGMPFEESVADHSFRCAVLGYVLAKMEGSDPYRVLLMTLFNDLHEARINDMHKVSQKYINAKEAEKKAFLAQTKKLDKRLKNDIRSSRDELTAQKTAESIVARDADILECLLQAKEYLDIGFKSAEKFFRKAPLHLKTKSARKLWKSARSWDSSRWWEKLSKFDR